MKGLIVLGLFGAIGFLAYKASASHKSSSEISLTVNGRSYRISSNEDELVVQGENNLEFSVDRNGNGFQLSGLPEDFATATDDLVDILLRWEETGVLKP